MALRLCLQRIYSARAAWVLQREAKGAVPTCSVCAHVASTEGIASTSAHAQTSPWSIWSRAAHQQAPGHQPHQHQEPQASHGAGQSIVSIQQQQQESECWSCKHHFRKGGLVCTGCEKLQPLDKSLDYFQLLAMPMTYDLDIARLEQQYKLLQWRVHPDRLVKQTPQEQGFSKELAAHVNMAYSVLRNPLSRANYMLAHRGLSAGEDAEGTIADTEYLEEVMEAREAVEEADDTETLTRLLTDNRAQQQQVIERLAKAFASSSGSSEAVDLTTRLTYLDKLEAEIISKLPALS